MEFKMENEVKSIAKGMGMMNARKENSNMVWQPKWRVRESERNG